MADQSQSSSSQQQIHSQQSQRSRSSNSTTATTTTPSESRRHSLDLTLTPGVLFSPSADSEFDQDDDNEDDDEDYHYRFQEGDLEIQTPADPHFSGGSANPNQNGRGGGGGGIGGGFSRIVDIEGEEGIGGGGGRYSGIQSPSPRSALTGLEFGGKQGNIDSRKKEQQGQGYTSLGLGTPSILLSPAFEDFPDFARSSAGSLHNDYDEQEEEETQPQQQQSQSWTYPTSRVSSTSTAQESEDRPITPPLNHLIHDPFDHPSISHINNDNNITNQEFQADSQSSSSYDFPVYSSFPSAQHDVSALFSAGSIGTPPPSTNNKKKSGPPPPINTNVFEAYSSPKNNNTAGRRSPISRRVSHGVSGSPTIAVSVANVWNTITSTIVSQPVDINIPTSTTNNVTSSSSSSRPPSRSGSRSPFIVTSVNTKPVSNGFANLLSFVGLRDQYLGFPKGSHHPLSFGSPSPSITPKIGGMSLPTIYTHSSASVGSSSSSSSAHGGSSRRFGISLSRRNWRKYLMVVGITTVVGYVIMSAMGGNDGSSGGFSLPYQELVASGLYRLDPRMAAAERVYDPTAEGRKQLVAEMGQGMSLLDKEEDELISEDDLYYDSLPNFPKGHRGTKGSNVNNAGTGMMRGDGGPSGGKKGNVKTISSISSLEDQIPSNLGSADDTIFGAEAQEKLAEIEAHTRTSSLMALTHFISHGGEFPLDWLNPIPGDEGGTLLDQVMVQVWNSGAGNGMEQVLTALANDLPMELGLKLDPPSEEELEMENNDDESESMDQLAERMRAKLTGGEADLKLKRKARVAGRKKATRASRFSRAKGRTFKAGWRVEQAEKAKVVIFSKSYCPFCKRAKETISGYRVTPAPYIVELDQRADGAVIQAILYALTSRRTVPNILLNYVPLGGSDEIMLLHAEGGLSRRMVEAGINVRNVRGN